jgi:hypothetical protein
MLRHSVSGGDAVHEETISPHVPHEGWSSFIAGPRCEHDWVGGNKRELTVSVDLVCWSGVRCSNGRVY